MGAKLELFRAIFFRADQFVCALAAYWLIIWWYFWINFAFDASKQASFIYTFLLSALSVVLATVKFLHRKDEYRDRSTKFMLCLSDVTISLFWAVAWVLLLNAKNKLECGPTIPHTKYCIRQAVQGLSLACTISWFTAGVWSVVFWILGLMFDACCGCTKRTKREALMRYQYPKYNYYG